MCCTPRGTAGRAAAFSTGVGGRPQPSPQPLFLRVPGHGDARQQVVCWSGPQGKGMHWLSLAAW